MRLINSTTHFEDGPLEGDRLKIFLPMTPSSWVGSPEYIRITRMRMTCGGGMGGAQWTEYIRRVSDIKSNEIQKFETFDGRQVLINSSFMVKADNCTLVKVMIDSKNPSYPVGIHTYYYLVEDGARVELCRR